MGAAGPPMPPSPSSADEEQGESSPVSGAPSSAGTAVAERASRGVAGSMVEPGEKFVGK